MLERVVQSLYAKSAVSARLYKVTTPRSAKDGFPWRETEYFTAHLLWTSVGYAVSTRLKTTLHNVGFTAIDVRPMKIAAASPIWR